MASDPTAPDPKPADPEPKPTKAAPRRSSQPQRRVDGNYWNEVLAFMRVNPSITACAAHMKADRKTIRRLWEQGKRGAPWGKRPMKEVLRVEQEMAAAERHRASDTAVGPAPADVSEARRDAIAVRIEEGKMLQGVRLNAQALLSMTSNLTRACLVLSRRVADTMQNNKSLRAGAALLLMQRASFIAQRSIYAAETAIDIERRLFGDPNKRLGDNESTTADDMTLEEAKAELDNITRIAREMEKRGLRVVEGEKKTATAK